MRAKISFYATAAVLSCVLAITIGCSKPPTDQQVATDIQNQLNADSGLQGKQLSVQAANGVVTLSGTVDNDAQRDAAARYASGAPGVKTVVNNLQVTPPTPVEAAQTPPPPVEETKPKPSEKPRPSKPKAHTPPPTPSSNPAPATPPTETANAQPATPPAPVTPPPPPPPQKVTIPSGTTLAVRLVDGLDTEKNQPGQTFHATLDSPLAVEGETAIPSGADVEGHIVDLKSAGKFAGQSLLVLQLDRISSGGKYYNVQTDQYKREGSSRGKNTAEKVGAGAGIGAIIGAIAGGGKGAAIGAAAGGGVGGGVQAATHGQQIKLPPETVVNFALQSALTVTPSKPSERPKLEVPPTQ
jgi:outer membrane biosynthesis protein TonB